MFSTTYNNNFYFKIIENDKVIPIQLWNDYEESYFSEISILQNFLDNGFADKYLDSLAISCENIYQLSEIERQILNFPQSYPFELYIESDGELHSNDFKFKVGFFEFAPNGNRINAERNGPILQVEGIQYLLSYNQYFVCKEIDKFNKMAFELRPKNLSFKSFADIKKVSNDLSIVLDAYLTNENVQIADKIKLDLKFHNGVLEIEPHLELPNSENFLNKFDHFPEVRDVYALNSIDGNRTRILIEDPVKIGLLNVKNYRKINDPELVSRIMEDPEEYFDDELIDISVFYSQRVKEIGLYKPKYYPFVCPYKSVWIPGIEIKDKIDGVKRVYFKNEIELQEFENEISHSILEKRDNVQWKGSEIPVENAQSFVKIAKKQFNSPTTSILKKEKNQESVLIIEENVLELGYSENDVVEATIEHTFFELDNLNKNISLKDHQKEGISWLQSLYTNGLTGCLLADDMGLGKSLQVLYFLEWFSQTTKFEKPCLIVAPVSLLENWESEYSKFFDNRHFTLKILYGKEKMGKDLVKSELEKLQKKQLILTNYSTLRTHQKLLCAVNYSVVVLDEAQSIKTPGTIITNVSKALKSDFKIAMTGTPVENNLIDLWCIIDFCVPGLLGNAKDFRKQYQEKLKLEETDLVILTEQLRNDIGIFIKRRLKRDVAKDLPKKYESNSLIEEIKSKFNSFQILKEMPKVQLDAYNLALEEAKNPILNGIERRNAILKTLWSIRDISDHPYLINYQILKFNSKELVESSAKLQSTLEIIIHVRNKEEKVIIFADRKETQKMLQKVVYDYFQKLPSIINGDTPSVKQDEEKSVLSRQQTIDRFQNEKGFSVIIMSQLAAGVGLNVTGANHVIHFSRHWNPAKEEQATDRAYRIGQNKDVHVYYPMSIFPDTFKEDDGTRQKSFDEILNTLLNQKKHLASSTLFPTEQAEVKPDVIFNSFTSSNSKYEKKKLVYEEVVRLNPNLFEAYISALYKENGYNTQLTSFSHDNGADVVAIKTSQSFLIQVKQSSSSVGIQAIQEITTAKNYYDSIYHEDFICLVISNNNYTESAEDMAKINKVTLINDNNLREMIIKSNISLYEVEQEESQRLKKQR